MKLITELLEESVELVTEAKTGQRFIEGIFMQSTVKNRNGRVYPKEILGKEVARYVREEVAQSRAIGELNHPANPVINPERASHLITSLKESGNDYIGKAKILDTPMGNIVSGLLDGGVRLGVSSRGLGSLTKKNGASVVGEDFRLCTVDIVADPSAPSAFVEGIMENAEWVLDGDQNFILMSETLKETIKKTSSSKLEEMKLVLFQSFINKL